jgi:hypothetical protein
VIDHVSNLHSNENSGKEQSSQSVTSWQSKALAEIPLSPEERHHDAKGEKARKDDGHNDPSIFLIIHPCEIVGHIALSKTIICEI